MLDVAVIDRTPGRDFAFHPGDAALPCRESSPEFRHIRVSNGEDLPEVAWQSVASLQDHVAVGRSGVIADFKPSAEIALQRVDFSGGLEVGLRKRHAGFQL